jgi:hypothetical protein
MSIFMLQSYMEQLTALAKRRRIKLVRAFAIAGVPDSTYYRARAGQHELSYRVAIRVADAMNDNAGDRAA